MLGDEGFFDELVGSKGVSRVDLLAVARACEGDGRKGGGEKVMIGSLERYIDRDVARLWSEALGREVKATLSDTAGMDAFEEHMKKGRICGVWARDLKLMYEIFEEEGFAMTEAEYEQQVALLGMKPEDYEKFVADTAKAWRA